MKALILAAGRGSRLGQSGDDRPKCLLEVGRRALVEHQLETLADAGVAPVGMVVGYCADEIKERIGIRAEFIDNPRWSTTNSLYSFWLAREWVDGGLLVLNSDTLFHPRILDRLLATDGDAFAFDSSSGNGREHMKVKLKDNRLVDISKTMKSTDADGENVGMLKLTAVTVKELFATAQSEIDAGKQNDWLGTAVRIIAQERDLTGVDVAGLPWGEIDSSYDLDVVRKQVLPAIERDIRKSSSRMRFVPWIAGVLMAALLATLSYKTWLAPTPVVQQVAWETADIEGIPATRISTTDRTQKWWTLASGQQAKVQVGRGTVRVESRMLLDKTTRGPSSYVLEVLLDGQRIDWFKASELPSATWKHEKWGVARRDRIKIDVPEGLHTLTVTLVAADSDRCLVRVRQVADLDSD